MCQGAMRGVFVVAFALIGRSLVAQADSARIDPRARVLIEHRCTDCHAVVALRLPGLSTVGPDLSSSYSTVPARYGMTLDRFLDQPTGIMTGILGGNAALAPPTRDSLVALFRDLYDEQLARQDSTRRAAPPVQTKPR